MRGDCARPGSAAAERVGRQRGAAGPWRGSLPQPAGFGSARPCWAAWRRRGHAGEVSDTEPGTERGERPRAGASLPAGEREGAETAAELSAGRAAPARSSGAFGSDPGRGAARSRPCPILAHPLFSSPMVPRR